jgi:hypothetical protein
MAWKVCLLDECVSSMHGDNREVPLDKSNALEYKVSLFCQTYTLTTSFDDGIMPN